MKKILFIVVIALGAMTSCDKVENPYPVAEATSLDYGLYPGGDSLDYWGTDGPVWTANTNTLRNVIIEDFTGHQCSYCPYAADTASSIHDADPTRSFVATIHSGPTGSGITGFQATSAEFPIDWTNPDGLSIGTYFGGLPSSAFIGNPRGTVSRIQDGGGQHTLAAPDWRLFAENAILEALQVNIQAKSNYYPSTRGVFLHSEIEVLDAGLINDLYTVVYLIEDSLVGKQKMPPPAPVNDSYIHRDIMRDCVQSGWKGKKLIPTNQVNGKYYFNYSFELPAEYEASNMHLLIYVRDEVTQEIYHVVKQDIE